MIFCRVNQSAWCSPALTGLQVLRDQTQFSFSLRHLERRPPVSGRACYPACHPERSEGSLRPGNEILRCAQDDRPSLQMSEGRQSSLTLFCSYATIYAWTIICHNKTRFIMQLLSVTASPGLAGL